MDEWNSINEAIIKGDAKTAGSTTEKAIAAGADPEDLINQQMIPAMDEVGRRYEEGEYYLPELLISARAMKAALELIRPLLAAKGTEPAGRVVVGTVAGDLHDIGKNLVASMLEGGGFEVIELGADVSAAKFVAAAKERNAHIVALSALLSTTMPGMEQVIKELNDAGARESVKVIVGGAPLTQGFANEIGADGYASNARAAVTLVRELIA